MTDRIDNLRELERNRKAKARAEAADIGGIDDIFNVKRRFDCERDFGLFCTTYLPEVFSLAWSSNHLVAISHIEEALLIGGNFAFAMPRGSGKSSLSRAAVLWATLYGHSKYSFLIGANASKGGEALDAIKTWLRYLPRLAEDFPEVVIPIVSLNGIAQRANAQKSNDRPTSIEWTQNRIVFGTVSYPQNHPRFVEGEISDLSGIIIGVSGLDANGIRGSNHTVQTGHIIRPDFCVLDDAQTDESAKSPNQCASREALINAAVLKMCGPTQVMRAVFPCTIIRRDDLAHRILNRKLNPQWRGAVTRLMESMPENLELWDQYFSVYEECLNAETLDYTRANNFYIANREALEEGAIHSWKERKGDNDVSAIQNAMHMFYTDRSSFFSEMQNDPLNEGEMMELLSVDEICAKQNTFGRLDIPDTTVEITGHIDVHKYVLYYTLIAWDSTFNGTVIDYCAFPDQKRRMFTHRDVRNTIQDLSHYETEEEQIHEALVLLRHHLMLRDYVKSDGVQAYISKIGVDCGYQKNTVEIFCRDHGQGIFVPFRGQGVTATQKPLTESSAGDILQKGHFWLTKHSSKNKNVPIVTFDSNYWKTFLHQRFITGPGGSGCLHMFNVGPGGQNRDHQLFAEQMHAEEYDRVQSEKSGRTVDEWTLLPNKDNHFFDCAVGACAAASMVGIILPAVDMRPVQAEKKIKRIKRVRRTPSRHRDPRRNQSWRK